ncbi:hypothetical protein [Beduinella massiliensis]|uniref:hypothetical protein n=1 Tax=Beduinella massiliensis TaxID=1852363 RepID=UPI000C8429E1
MYNLGACKLCKQGVLELLKEKETGKIFIICDECMAEWTDPIDALEMKNYSRFKLEIGPVEDPTQEEIDKLNWPVEIYNSI